MPYFYPKSGFFCSVQILNSHGNGLGVDDEDPTEMIFEAKSPLCFRIWYRKNSS